MLRNRFEFPTSSPDNLREIKIVLNEVLIIFQTQIQFRIRLGAGNLVHTLRLKIPPSPTTHEFLTLA